jgi:hypothetical protein
MKILDEEFSLNELLDSNPPCTIQFLCEVNIPLEEVLTKGTFLQFFSSEEHGNHSPDAFYRISEDYNPKTKVLHLSKKGAVKDKLKILNFYEKGIEKSILDLRKDSFIIRGPRYVPKEFAKYSAKGIQESAR